MAKGWRDTVGEIRSRRIPMRRALAWGCQPTNLPRISWRLGLLPFLVVSMIGPALSRGPYLQSVTATGAIVVWRTNVAGDGRVEYGVGDYSHSMVDPGPTTEHVITLTGLLTGTEVMYRVLSSDIELAAGSFRTAAAPDQAFSFGVIGDSGIGSTAQQQVADRLVALDPDFVLHTGDVVYPKGQADGYDPFFFLPYQTLLKRAPMFPTLGNHDYGTARGQPYLDAFYLPHNNPADSEKYYSFDWGSAHFTALDFNDGPSPAQLDWLQADLSAVDKPWKFVFYHQAIYSSGPHGDEAYIIGKRAVLAPIFEAHQVDVVFNGHDHDYERTQSINGVVYIVSGGGGASLYKVNPQSFSAYAETTHHTVFVSINGCALNLQAVKPDGTVFDTLALNKACAEPTPEPTPVPTLTPSPTPAFVFARTGWVFLPVLFKEWMTR
jgi:acid phosphatase type 7